MRDIVTQTHDSTSGLTGLGLVEDAQLISEAIRSHSWVDGTLGGVGAALDGLSLAFDPLGTLAAWGVGWLLEHVGPLQDVLDRLAGDAEEIAAQAAIWSQVAALTDTASQEFAAHVRVETAGWHGAAAAGYRAHAGEQFATLQGISVAAGGISSAVEGAGLVVGFVRGIVRDLIAQFVATLAVRLPQWLAAEGLTLGLATPLVASQVAGLVTRWVNKIQHFIRALVDSLRRLLPMINRLGDVLERLRRLTDRLARSGHPNSPERGGRHEESPGGEGGGSGAPDQRKKPADDDNTSGAFVGRIVSEPLSLVGHSAQSIADRFNAAGYAATVERTGKKGTSGNAVQVRIEGHPEITNIQVHPGGGRHTPEGSPYWEISTSTVGKIWVIPKDFRGADQLGGGVVRHDE